MKDRDVIVTIGLCFLVAVLEGFDIQAMGVAAPRIAPEFALDARQMGWVFGISNIGLVIGASLGGWLADKSGRKPVLIGAVAAFGVFTVATAMVDNYHSMLAVRFCAGLGFGAALPNLMAIAAEISRPEKAATTAAVMFCGMPAGGALAALSTQLLPSGFDWRTLFYIGGALPVLLIPALLRSMPETLVRISGQRGPREPVWGVLFGEGRAASTLLLWLAFLPTLLILYLFLNWLPMLVIAKGLDRAIAPQASLAFNFGSVLGAVLFGRLADRFHFRWPLTFAYLALVVTLVLLGMSSGHAAVIALSGGVGFFLLGANYALYGVAPVYYPQRIRGTGAGASIAVGRVGAIAGPMLAGALIAGGTSAPGVVWYMVPVAAISAVAVLALSYRAASGEVGQ